MLQQKKLKFCFKILPGGEDYELQKERITEIAEDFRL